MNLLTAHIIIGNSILPTHYKNPNGRVSESPILSDASILKSIWTVVEK